MLRAKVYLDQFGEWTVSLWRNDNRGVPYLFGLITFVDWEHALRFAIWRVGLSG